MTAGFVRAGFKPVLAVEANLAAAATYAANFGTNVTVHCDLAEISLDQIPEADVIIGGPPCQRFSSLGARDVGDSRTQLWREYLRVIDHARPKIFVLESVARFIDGAEFLMLRAAVDAGALQEYELAFDVLNAADFGVAQRRTRCVVIGSRIGRISIQAPTHSKAGDNGLTRWNTVRSRIGNLPPARRTSLPDTTTTFHGETVPGVFSGMDVHVGRQSTKVALRRYDCIPPGGSRFDLPDELLPECWRRAHTGSSEAMGRLRWDAPASAIRTEFFKPEKGRYIHPQWDADYPTNRINRPITHLEAALLQDFPENFLWCGSKTEIARQIGHAVPIGLARAVGESIRDAIGGSSAIIHQPSLFGEGVPSDRTRNKLPVTGPPPWEDDRDLDAVTDFFDTPRLALIMGACVREAIDEAIDTPRTGRWHLDQCDDQEKNYIGVIIERIVRQKYNLPHGIVSQDFHVAGVDFDCKWSRNFGGWQIPQEAVGHVCLVLYGDDLYEDMAVGLIRVEDALLVGGNRDTKREIQSPGGRSRIRWLHARGPGLPTNFLMSLRESDREAILAPRGGTIEHASFSNAAKA